MLKSNRLQADVIGITTRVGIPVPFLFSETRYRWKRAKHMSFPRTEAFEALRQCGGLAL